MSLLALSRHIGLIDWIFVFSEPVRVGSTLGSALFLGTYTVMAAGLGAALLLRPKPDSGFWGSHYVRHVLAGLVVLNLAAMWVSGARSALLGVAAMALLFAGGILLLDRRSAILKMQRWGCSAVIVVMSAAGLMSGRVGIATEYDVMFRRLASTAYRRK